MRTYFSEKNLIQASLLGAVVTLMSVPRILAGSLNPAFYVAAAFLSMTLVCGAVTAWGRNLGMGGVWPGRDGLRHNLAFAGLAGLALALVHVFLLDPVFSQAIEKTGDSTFMELHYPGTWGNCLALVLWTTGFETVFFYAATPSFVVRVARRIWPAYVFAATLRLMVTLHQMGTAGIDEAGHLFAAGSIVTSFVTVLLFVRGGLPAAMLFTAVLNLRLLLHL